MTRFEQLKSITTLQEAVAFLQTAIGPDGIEGAELCINCPDKAPKCHKEICNTRLLEAYLNQEI